MSDQELIGKYGEEYRNTWRELEKLHAEVGNYISQLKTAIAQLEKPAKPVEPQAPNSITVVNVEYPPSHKVQELISEIMRLTAELERARSGLLRLGIPVPSWTSRPIY